MSNVPVLALDLSTNTGWALSDRNNVITSGVQVFDLKRGESKGMRFLRFRKWLKDIIRLGELGKDFSETNPGLVAWEMAHHRGSHATELCVGLVTDTMAEAALFGLEHMSIHSASLKKFATGNGRASKEDMISKVKELYPNLEIIDDNHADALLLLKYAMDEIGKI